MVLVSCKSGLKSLPATFIFSIGVFADVHWSIKGTLTSFNFSKNVWLIQIYNFTQNEKSLLILCQSGHVVEVHSPDPKALMPSKTFHLPGLPRRFFRFRSIKSRIEVWTRSFFRSRCFTYFPSLMFDAGTIIGVNPLCVSERDRDDKMPDCKGEDERERWSNERLETAGDGAWGGKTERVTSHLYPRSSKSTLLWILLRTWPVLAFHGTHSQINYLT